MTGCIVVPRSGERALATPSVIAHAAVAVGHRVADIDNSITLAGSAPQRDGEDQFNAQLVRLADLLLTLWAATSLVAIAGYALVTAAAG